MSKENLVKRSEAVLLLGVSQSSLISYVRQGKITQYGGGKTGTPAKYDRNELERFKQEREARALQPLQVA